MPTPDTAGKPGDPQKQGPPQIPGRTVLWWVVLIAIMLIWNMYFVLKPRNGAEVAIAYTTFLAQVRTGNVSEVHIQGDKITGQFRKPWSEPEKSPEIPSKQAPQVPPGQQERRPAAPTHTRFASTFPGVVGDPDLLSLLEIHGVVVDVSSPEGPWLLNLLASALPLLILLGFFWWMTARARRSQSGLFGFGKMKARRYAKDHPEVTFNDVAGEDEAKAELEEEVDFLRHPKKYHDLGARIPRGVLLVGPPGTGKTLLARAVAGEAGVPFFNISASEFVEMFVGVGASRVRDLFEQAKAAAPSIVFVDELDAVGRRRGAGVGAVNDEREQTLNQLLVEMDGFDERQEVIIMAATNRPDVLDPALLRPGRFDRQVVVNLPDRKGREGILRIHTRKLPLAQAVDLAILARSTTGFSGADLANLCNEAALVAARRSHTEVSMLDFEEAQDKVLLGSARASLVDLRERTVVAYHESGHALVAWFTPAADPVHKVSIVPHGRTLGVTEQIPWEDRANYSSSYLTARLAVMLGGRSAEEIAIGDITTGAENDLVEATRLARRMVTRWGMGKLGVVAYKTDDQQPFLGYELSQGRDYSEETAARIDEEVHRLLEEAHQTVRSLLTKKRKQLDRLVETLLREETVTQDELVEILGPLCGNAASGGAVSGSV